MPANALTYRNLDLGATGQVIKAGPGHLLGYYIANNASAARYVKVYDKATAPTAANTPVMTLCLPATSAANVLADVGLDFPAGISVRATTGLADADTGAPSAGDVVANFWYR
jgi:hypothetical protein